MKTMLCALFLYFGFILPVQGAGSLWGPQDAYFKTLKRYTRHQEVYSRLNLHADLIWHATYFSPELLQAFRQSYQRHYPHGQDFLAQQKAEGWLYPQTNAAVFLVVLYSQQRSMLSLGQRDSLWDLALETGAKTYKPLKVERIDPTPFESYFFPHLDRWSQVYRVTFPSIDLPEKARAMLILSSVLAHSRLKF